MNICSVCRQCYDDEVTVCAAEGHGALSRVREGTRSQVDGYKIDLRIEPDSPGEIYKAVHLASGKSVLIRFIKAPSQTLPSETLQNELEKAAAVSHPNLARIFEYGKIDEDEFFAVLEDAPGESLREHLARNSPLPERSAIRIARQCAEALEALHNAGLVHRAVSPANISLSDMDGENIAVKLGDIDFGGVRQKCVAAGARGVDAKTEILRYFSPEQFSGDEIDFRSDIYSLAVTFYEMLLGRSPYDALDPQSIMSYAFKESDVERLHFDLRALLAYTLRQCLQQRLNLRPPTTNNLARQLRHIEQIAAPPAISVAESAFGQPKQKRFETVSRPEKPQTAVTSAGEKTENLEAEISNAEVLKAEIPIAEIPNYETPAPTPTEPEAAPVESEIFFDDLDSEPEELLSEPEKLNVEPEEAIVEQKELIAEPEELNAGSKELIAEQREIIAGPEEPLSEPEELFDEPETLPVFSAVQPPENEVSASVASDEPETAIENFEDEALLNASAEIRTAASGEDEAENAESLIETDAAAEEKISERRTEKYSDDSVELVSADFKPEDFNSEDFDSAYFDSEDLDSPDLDSTELDSADFVDIETEEEPTDHQSPLDRHVFNSFGEYAQPRASSSNRTAVHITGLLFLAAIVGFAAFSVFDRQSVEKTAVSNAPAIPGKLKTDEQKISATDDLRRETDISAEKINAPQTDGPVQNAEIQTVEPALRTNDKKAAVSEPARPLSESKTPLKASAVRKKTNAETVEKTAENAEKKAERRPAVRQKTDLMQRRADKKTNPPVKTGDGMTRPRIVTNIKDRN